jgi:glucose-6-phosphate dehydrogenase assembly protein OpcA
VRLSLDAVDAEMARLWKDEVERGGAPRIELCTLVAVASEPALVGRAQSVVATVATAYPSRTIVTKWRQGAGDAILAEAELHRVSPGGAACGDAIVLEATGAGRDWIPENVDRLSLPDLPLCVWWVGDLPDFDHLFDRLVVQADVVIVNSGEMDLRDLEKLSVIATRIRSGCALNDLTWIRLHPLQELVARFFDDEVALGCLRSVERVSIDFAPRDGEQDAASTQAGLLFGWIANALGVRAEPPTWRRGAGWSEVSLGSLTGRFEHAPRTDVSPGSIVRVAIECDGARFEVQRQDDPDVLRWSREAPGAPVPPQTLRAAAVQEASLLIRCLERPKRDALFEKSLRLGSRIVRPVAPRPSTRAEG